jgi:hypothetical protein
MDGGQSENQDRGQWEDNVAVNDKCLSQSTGTTEGFSIPFF